MRTDSRLAGSNHQSNVDLRLLTSWPTDLTYDRVRTINRLRLEYFPALERAFYYSKSKSALTLLSDYQTPEALRRIGICRLTKWLKNRGYRNSISVAKLAIDAAASQHTIIPTQTVGLAIVKQLAAKIDEELSDLDQEIEHRFQNREGADVLLSLPGFGPLLAAEFLANIGGNIDAFETIDRLASVAGLAPVPRDSGRMGCNLHRLRRFNCRLLRTCCLAALSSMKNSPATMTFDDRQRTERKSHKQALIALARRRINVIWAMLRDRTPY